MGYANRMRNAYMKIVLLLAVLVGGDSAAGASDLLDCPTEGIKDNCVGIWTDSNEVTYIGELKSSMPNGRGTSNAMGDTYAGEFKDDQFNGQGTYTYADGSKYVGQWKNGKRSGRGTYTSTDRAIREGIWQDGNFLGTVLEVERAERVRRGKEDKYERIYNACVLDKGSDADTSVSSLESSLKTTCASIAEDPSFLEVLRYD